ncbi:MAG: hypothetical protein K6E63_09200 [Lachnospiraceae bacterium]|nr:hypothetical protein [Lachnospiraceae bacterium]
MKKVRSMLKSLLSISLALAMIFEAMPVQALAGERQDVYLDEIEIPQDVLDGDFFYLGNTQLSIPESGDGRYLFKVARGGDAASESTALVKIADLTAKFGEDYVVSVHDGSAKVDNPDDNMSLMEMMQGSDYVQSALTDEETAQMAIESDEEGQAALNEGVDTALDFLAEESGLKDKYHDGYPGVTDIDEADASDPEPQNDADVNDSTKIDPVTEDDSEDMELNGVTLEDGSETVSIDDGEADDNSVQQARSMFTGVEGSSQRLTSETSMAQAYKDLQSIADVMTNVVVGASVELTFKEGEKEKYLEIIPKNNVRGDGNRMFYMILAAPAGSTTNSAISTCAVTIVDDEEPIPSSVSFSQELYIHEPGTETVKVTVVREGAINKVASVKVSTTDEGSALVGRDYAKVDTTMFFPFGISSLDLDIPVRTAYFNGEKDFFLELTPESGCSVEQSVTRITLEGTYGDGSALLEESREKAAGDKAASNNSAGGDKAGDVDDPDTLSRDGDLLSNDVSRIHTLDSINIRKPWATNYSDVYGDFEWAKGDTEYNPNPSKWHYDTYLNGSFIGDNAYDDAKCAWNLMPKNNKDLSGYNPDADVTVHDYKIKKNTSTGVTYRLSDDDNPYWLAGAQVKWSTGNHKDAEMCVEISGDPHPWYTGHNEDPDDPDYPEDDDYYLYHRVTSFDADTDNMFPSTKDSNKSSASRPLYIHFMDKGNCRDCTNMWIYDIKPILRPFRFKLMKSEGLEFLTANGTMEKDNGAAESVRFSDGTNGQQTVFLNDSITVVQPTGDNISKYAQIEGLQISCDNENWYDLDVKCSDGKTVIYTLSEEGIKSFVAQMGEYNFYKALEDNTYLNTNAKFSPYADSVAKYAALYVRPTFKKIPVKLTISNPYKFPVTVSLSGTDYNLNALESREVTYYRGDALKATVALSGTEASQYKPCGVRIKYKHKTNGEFDKTYNFVAGGPVYISNNDTNGRLDFDCDDNGVTIEPTLQESHNSIVVRVKTTELNRFKQDSGLFAGAGTVIGEYTEFSYADESQTVYGKVYPVSVMPADDNTVCMWHDNNTGRYYEGNTLYFKAGDDSEKNVIMLSAADKKYDVKLTGTLWYMSYDLLAKSASSISALPAGGALVSAGSGYAVADEDGKFKTGAIPVWGGDKDTATYIRYMVTVNGDQNIREVALAGGRKEIDVTSDFKEGVSPAGAEIIREMKIEGAFKDSSDYSVTDGYLLPIVNSEEVYFSISVKPSEYRYFDQEKAKELTNVETPKKVQLLVYGRDHKLRGKYDEVTGTLDEATGRYIFKSTVVFSSESKEDAQKTFDVLPGDMLYIRLSTDRGDLFVENGDKTIEEIDYVYTDLYTGYTFTSPDGYEPPLEQGVTSPISFSYDNLPFLDFVGTKLDFPFAKVGFIQTDFGEGRKGYRMYIGVSIVQIYDLATKNSKSSFIGDDGVNWEGKFFEKKSFDNFKNTLTDCFSKTFGDPEGLNAAIQSGSLGAPQWKFDVMVGMFFDFEFPVATAGGGGSVESKDCIFTGVSVFLAVSIGFKQNWYYIVPVVFIPVYIGIKMEGTVMGFAGAKASAEANITYDEAKKATVNFDEALDEFTGAVVCAATVQIHAGVGLEGTIGAKAKGTINVVSGYASERGRDNPYDAGLYMGLNVGLELDLFLTSKEYNWTVTDGKWGSLEYYDEQMKNLKKVDTSTSDGMGLDESSEGFSFRKGSGIDSTWRGSQVNSELSIDRSAFAPNAEKTRVLVNNTYENPEAKLITLQDGTVVLGFIDSDNSKGEFQRTTFKLATYKNDKWSDPVPVSDSPTADFHPSICEMKDGKVMAAWVSTGDTSIDEKTSTIDYLESMEVYVAIATIGSDGNITMGEPVKITNDHRKKVIDGQEKAVGYYDCNPTVICDMVSGDAMVYYIKAGRVTDNEFELANSFTNDCVICYMPYSYDGVEVEGKTEHWLFDYFYEGEVAGGKDSEKILIENWGGQRFLDSPTFTGKDGETEYYQIPDFNAIAFNQQGIYSYSIDKDGSLDTDADRELFLQVYDFKTHHTKHRIQLTNDEVADARPQLFRSKMISSTDGVVDGGTHTKLFWYRAGNEVVFIDVTELLRNGIDDKGNLIPSESEGKDECTYATPRYLTIASDDSQGQKQMADFVVTEDDKGSLYIVWTEGEDDAREIWAISHLSSGADEENASGGSYWSAPYQLTHDGYVNDGLAVTVSDEDLIVVGNRYKQAFNYDSDGSISSDDPLSISDNGLTATVMEPCGAMLAEDIKVYYSELGEETGTEAELPEGGKSVDIRVDLINGGLTTAKGYKTTLYAVDKNGTETAIDTKVIGDALRPGARSSVLFAGYTLPADVEGLYFKAVTQELKDGSVYYDNDHEFTTEPFEVRGDYVFDNVITYQLPDGFHIAGNVTNRGNGSASDSELVTVNLNGPYNMDLKFDKAERVLGQFGLDGLAPGASMAFDEPVNITAKMMEEYGYVHATVAVEDEGERILGGIASVDFTMTMPIGFKAQSVSVKAGENVKPVITDALGTAYGESDVILTVDETDTALIKDGRIYGVKDGVATLSAIHAQSGAVATAKIIVGGGISSDDIPDEDIPEGLWYTIVDDNGSKCDAFTYTGKAIKPEVHVYDGVRSLEKGKDYTVDYKNNTNVYTLKKGEEGFDEAKAPTVVIKGKGNYTETDVLCFTITPIDLGKDAAVYADDMFIKYTGNELKPDPAVKFGKNKLKNGTDYDVAYYKKDATEAVASIKDAGTYDIVVTGKGNYTGSIIVKVTVGDPKKIKPVSKLKVDKIASVKYTGDQVKPALTVKDGKKVLNGDYGSGNSSAAYDYSVIYYNNTNAGTAYAVIKGNPEAGYAGSRKVEFKIIGRSLKGAAVSGIPKSGYAFTGDAVTLNDQLLKGTVKVTAKDGTELKLYTGKGEPGERSYTVSYKNNKKPGTAKAVFKGVGGCMDSIEVKFKITKASLASESAEVSIDETAPYSKAGSKAGVIVKYAGTILKEGKDYTVSYKNNKNAGDTAEAVVKGKGNYTDAYGRELKFTVTARDLEGLEITASDVVFKDKAGIYKSKLVIMDGGKKLKAGKDYEKAVTYTYAKDGEGHNAGDPVSDTEVLPAGTEILATAKAAGNNYTGSVSTTFRIVKSDIKKVKLKGRVEAKAYTGYEVKLSEADIPLAVPATVEEGGTTVHNWEIVEGSYKNNVNKGTASVTVRGLGDYGGTKVIKFKIGTKGFKWLKKQ